MNTQIETVSMQQWPAGKSTATRFRLIYMSCRRLLDYPSSVQRVKLGDVTPTEAAKKAHWFFKNHHAFKIITATEDGWFYIRRRSEEKAI